MNRLTFFTFILFVYINAFPQTVERGIFSNSGQKLNGSLVKGVWTVGDLATESLESENYMVTQGFCQTNILELINGQSGDRDILRLFPVPAHDVLNFSTKNTSLNKFKAVIFNEAGTVVLSTDVDGAYGGGKIDISNLYTSKYFVKIIDRENNKIIGYNLFIKIKK
jgi:hypothetical protein